MTNQHEELGEKRARHLREIIVVRWKLHKFLCPLNTRHTARNQISRNTKTERDIQVSRRHLDDEKDHLTVIIIAWEWRKLNVHLWISLNCKIWVILEILVLTGL